jgi:hypothetical protein
VKKGREGFEEQAANTSGVKWDQCQGTMSKGSTARQSAVRALVFFSILLDILTMLFSAIHSFHGIACGCVSDRPAHYCGGAHTIQYFAIHDPSSMS